MGNNKINRFTRNTTNSRKDRSRKRKHIFYRKSGERNSSNNNTSAKKIKQHDEDLNVPQDDHTVYRLLNFITVFTAISNLVKCKKCNCDVNFQICSERGLGFKIAVMCNECQPTYINSSPFIGHTYEINRRFIYVMRILGLGLEGCKKFCGLMDMPAFLVQKTYDIIVKNMSACVNTVAKKVFVKAAKEEKKTIKRKILGGKGKLTGKLIDKLTVYYGLAIRRNCESIEKMRNAIWATFYHYSSTDQNPQHDHCLSGEESWCKWQKAVANNELNSFKHTYDSLSNDVLQAIRPIYDDLSKDALLDRCIGGFNQNNNESYNQLIWIITRKTLASSSTMVTIAANISACVFNEGCSAHLAMLNSMGITLGQNAHNYCRQADEKRITEAERRAQLATREARILRRQQQSSTLDVAEAAEDLLYGPGIDDSV
ncbi:hypothetical protein ALC62_13786 [Cyphomyrmex costatus]|uniref:Mutator-like transposase domain-containing protein n=1 Tax=Cyphomyrmex costatus TaxID=456900 RepID=A0A151I9H1_9HYME|nr:hypothetical protein ALC62_13786 [Cyphomyrmex costatus]